MSLADAYQDSTDQALRVLDARPPDPPVQKHSSWAGYRSTAGGLGGFLDQVADIGMAAAGGIPAAAAELTGNLGEIQQRSPLSPVGLGQKLLTDVSGAMQPDMGRTDSAAIYEQARALAPDPATAGKAEQITFGLSKGLAKAVGAVATLGPLGGAAAFGASEGLSTAAELKAAGVDDGTAGQVAAVTGIGSGAALLLPVVGSTIARSIALMLPAAGAYMAQMEANRKILAQADYAALAQRYDPLDPLGLALTVLPGAAIAAALHGLRLPNAKAAEGESGAPSAEQIDALMTHNLSLQREAIQSVPPEARTVPAEQLAPELNGPGRTVAGRLRELGVPEQEAQDKGLLWDSFFRSMGDQTGEAPETLMERYFGGIGRGDEDTPAMFNILKQSGDAASGSAFYSELSRQVDATRMGSAPAKGWQDTLKGMVGKGAVKQAEIETTGLNDWLALQPGKVSKEQVQDFLKNNGVQVQEVTLQSKESATSELDTSFAKSGYQLKGSDGSFDYRDQQGKSVSYDELPPQLKEAVDNAAKGFDGVKFASYQLPGGENYRELLLTLPERGKVIETPTQNPRGWGDTDGGDIGVIRTGGEEDFRNSHFPGHANILAHVRFNERTDAEGKKVLFIEELQSDWAQKGRKEGFVADDAERAKIEAEYHAANKALSDAVDSGTVDERIAAAERSSRAVDAYNTRINDAKIPAAPFVGKTEAWTALALKRMIRYAAEHGFDRVAWTTGEQQAARYDLSKHVDAVHYNPETQRLVATKDGARVMDENSVTPEKLADYVGKEVAENLLKSESVASTGLRTVSGDGLKVGGEGMKGYYDKIVPSVAKDVLKKLGRGKVGEIFIPDPKSDVTWDGMNQPGFDITPELRDKVMAGQPLFQRGDAQPSGYLEFGRGGKMSIALLKSADTSTFLHESGHFFLEVINDLSPATPALGRMVDDVHQWFGIPGDTPQARAEAWNSMSLEQKRPYHEQWARGFEHYLLDGQAPTARLKAAFGRFRDWLLAVYRSAADLNVTLSPEVRAVMDRMLGSEKDHPSETPQGPAGATESPPRGNAGEAPAAVSDLDQLLASGAPNLGNARPLDHPDLRRQLQDMVDESGWDEVGGKMIRSTDAAGHETISRTQWIPRAEWWPDRPDKLNVQQIREAVRKQLAGEKLKVAEQRTIDYMAKIANDRLDAVQQLGAEEFAASMADVEAAGLEPTTENVFDSHAVARAVEINPAAAQLAMTAYDVHDDTALFMGEIRSILDEHLQGDPADPGRAEDTGAPDNPIRAEAERIAAAHPERVIRLGEAADGGPLTTTVQQFLDTARAEAAQARQDAGLFQVAAECLLGQL